MNEEDLDEKVRRLEEQLAKVRQKMALKRAMKNKKKVVKVAKPPSNNQFMADSWSNLTTNTTTLMCSKCGQDGDSIKGKFNGVRQHHPNKKEFVV